MRIVWDQDNSRFIAELTPGEQWREDQEAAKAAGFKTTGPPAWQWYATKASSLNKLRENRPKSGLVLTEIALANYQTLNQKEEQKAALKKQFKDAQKKAKKESKDPEISGLVELIIPEKGYIDASDLPPLESNWKPPVHELLGPDGYGFGYCIICEQPLIMLDYSDICIWCDLVQRGER